ncbi:MAG: putative addiction module antidote protein [bacterium]|nr:putative addiction module antidote protein [bacterium]
MTKFSAEELKISRWDSAEMLENQADIDSYLKVAFESNDYRHIADALGVAARAQSMLKISKKTGLARENLYNSLSYSGNPTLHTVTQVMSVLGYRLSFTKVGTQTCESF